MAVLGPLSVLGAGTSTSDRKRPPGNCPAGPPAAPARKRPATAARSLLRLASALSRCERRAVGAAADANYVKSFDKFVAWVRARGRRTPTTLPTFQLLVLGFLDDLFE